jgi:hemolysin activation/secretion protein
MFFKLFIFIAIFSIPGAGAARAAPASALDQREQQEAARRRQQEQEERMGAPQVSLQEAGGKQKTIQLPKEEISFPIKEIIVESGEPGRFKWVRKAVGPFNGQEIGINGINLLAKFISEKIIEKGYITTTVTVPEQDLATGTLRFRIVPGRIGGVRLEGSAGWGTWRTAFPVRRGKVLNLRDLEQGLEQMKRVPNQDAKMQLVPGDDPGTSIVAVAVERSKPWHIGVSMDDSNPKSIGRLGASFNAAFYNPFGLNDTLSYSYGKDAEGNDREYGNDNYSVSYAVPYGNYALRILKYKNTYYQTVPGISPFMSEGKSDALEIGAERLLYRDRTRKVQTSFKVIRKNRRNYIDGEEIQVQRQKTVAYQAGLLYRQYFGQKIIDARIYYQKGVPWWGARPGYGDGVPGMGTTRYALWGWDFNFISPLRIGKTAARYTFAARGQHTGYTLYSSDHFSIAGRYTVRGFSGENTLAAESGFLLRNEISFPMERLHGEIYVGLDAGRVWGPSGLYLTGRNLAGAVLGIRGRLLKQMQYDCFIGAPLYKPDGFKAGKTALGFQVYWQF